MIRIGCPQCATVYNLDDGFLNKSVVCQKCSHRFVIAPESLLEAPAPAPSLEVELPIDEPELPEAIPAPPGRPPASPPRNRRRKQKSILGPALVIGGTVIAVVAVVAVSIYVLIQGLEEEKKRPTPGPVASGPPPQPPQNPFANIPNIENRKADFVLNRVDSPNTGLTVFRPAGPRWPNGQEAAANAGELSPVNQLKRSAVLIRVESQRGDGNGSGFFCLEPGLVVTNAHVVGMMKPSDPPPTSLKVIVNSNESDETTFNAQVVAVDRYNDLAILRVRGSNLPPPLEIISSTSLSETQEVFVGGFPLAAMVGANMTVSRSNVSSLRKDDGRLVRVQVQKSMEPGNSGGPVVDSKGRVVGVSVAILGDSDLNFAVPTDFIRDLYRGAVRVMLLTPPSRTDTGLEVPTRIHFDDAMGRIGGVQVDWWTGPPGPARVGGAGEPSAALAGDSPRQSAPLKYQRNKARGVATGVLELPPLPEGKVYWLQVVTTDNKDKQRTYFSPQSYQPGPMIDAAPTAVTDGDFGPSHIELLYRSTWRVRSDQSEFPFSPLRLYLKNNWQQDGDDEAKAKVTAFKFGSRANNEPFPLAQLFTLMATTGFGRRGLPPGVPGAGPSAAAGPDDSVLGPADRYSYELFRPMIQGLRAELELDVPKGQLKPQTTSWKQTVKLPVPYVLGRTELSKLEVGFRYLGTEIQQNRKIAVFEMESSVAPSAEMPATGLLWGLAKVDVATCETVDHYAYLELEIERATLPVAPNLAASGASLLGHLEVRLRTNRPDESGTDDDD